MIELLNNTHIETIKPLFYKNLYMGVDHRTSFFMDKDVDFLSMAYNNFCETYLTDLRNYKAFGCVEDGVVKAYIAFYESDESPEWFWTQVRSGSSDRLPEILDEVMSYNEQNGRLKFYSMFNLKYAKTFRRLAFSKENSDRYGMFDEYIVPAKTKCKYAMHWQVLYNRTLVPVDTVVRCTFLKHEFRNIPVAGAL